LGASTDTGDVMGVVQGNCSQDNHLQAMPALLRSWQQSSDLGHFKEMSSKPKSCGRPSDDVLQTILSTFIGKVSWQYPVFSSKTVKGKPLFLWALEGRISEIGEIPVRNSEIYALSLIEDKFGDAILKMNISELQDMVYAKIDSIPKVRQNVVNGEDTKKLGADFRRKEVLQSWEDFFERFTLSTSEQTQVFEVIKVRCICSSGTYMRTLAQKIGEKLGVPAMAFSIVRTKIMI